MKKIEKILKWIGGALLLLVFLTCLISINLTYNISGEEEVNVKYLNNNPYKDFSEKDIIEQIKSHSNILDSIKDINTTMLEDLILQNKFVKKAEVYLTTDHLLDVYVYFREPFVKVLKNEKIYYCDEDGVILPALSRVEDLLVISGDVDENRFKDVIVIATEIYNNNMLNNLIGGIHYDQDNGYTLSSKICDLSIRFGKDMPINIEGKSDILELFSVFLSKELGCDYCEAINLEFDNQIICIK